MTRKGIVAVALVSLALLASACARATPTPTPAPGPVATIAPATPAPGVAATPTPPPTPRVVKPTGELRMALTYIGVEILDPTMGPAGIKLAATNLYDSVVGAAPQGEVSPDFGLAYKWEASADKKTWTFYLRQGIKFHNGDELTSEDVKFTIERFISKNISTNASVLKANIERIETPDPYKVVFHTKPYGFLDLLLSNLVGAEGLVLPSKYLREKGEDYFLRNPIGSGPYRVKEQVLGSYMLFEAVDNHWSGVVPKFKKFTLFLVPEESTRIAMLKTGQADIIDIGREKMKELPQFNVYQKEGAVVVVLWMDRQWDPATHLSDKRVREALNLAVNRQELLEHIFAGSGTLHYGDMFYQPIAVGYEPMPAYPYDPDKAKRLIAEAFPKGVTLDFYSYPRPGNPELTRMNEAIAGYLDKVGVKTKMIPLAEYGTYRSIKTKGPANTIAGMSTEGRPLLGPVWRTVWHSTGILTMAKDPTLDAMVDTLDAAADAKEAGEGHRRIARYLRENHYALGILISGLPYAANPQKIKAWDMGKVHFDLNIPRGVK